MGCVQSASFIPSVRFWDGRLRTSVDSVGIKRKEKIRYELLLIGHCEGVILVLSRFTLKMLLFYSVRTLS